MHKSVQITTIVVVGVIVLALLGYLVFSKINPSSNTVSVTGESSITGIPDLVAVYFSIQTTGETSKEATDKNAEIVDETILQILKLGFERKDLETLDFNVYPEYDWSDEKREEIGYRATHTIRVKLPSTESSRIGSIIDAGISAGAGINYISFEFSESKQNEYQAEALKKASEDARLKAESIAFGIGKKVGSLVSISDSSFGYYPYRFYEGAGVTDSAEAKQAVTNIQPGTQEISARVTAVFKLK